MVGRVEGVEAVGMHLLAAVAAIELVVEEERHLVDRVVGRDVEGIEQVLLTVERSSANGIWEPVMTGLCRSSSMKENCAEAVNDMVSVPCRMTKPSYLS